MSSDITDQPLWTPTPERVGASSLARWAARLVEQPGGPAAADYESMHRWSVAEPSAFWAEAWNEMVPAVPLVGDAVVASAVMTRTRWFPDVRFNVAERILAGDSDPSQFPGAEDPMLISVGEDGTRVELARGEVRRTVASIASALRADGIVPGDRVAAWMPNDAAAMMVMLGAASVGAVFSSCSPDFGSDGVLDRFGQIEPKVLVACDGYRYAGREHDRTSVLADIAAGLPSLQRLVVVPSGIGDPAAAGADAVTWDSWLAGHSDAGEQFEQLPFDHPWYVLFSSGTTGVPKCIVHRTGGVLLQHLKEHRLQLDIRPGDRVAYFTTTGWMMWNWLASVPASGATAVLFDGNPFHPGPQRLWELVAHERLDFLGVSAKYLDSVRQSGFEPATLDLSSLRSLASTGSPLSPETHRWVMESVAPAASADGLHVASISGGTDLCACFLCGDPTSAVYAGELQRPALGMAVQVWTDLGEPAAPGERGEMVCTSAFPSMPLAFWGDGWAAGDLDSWGSGGGRSGAAEPGPKYLSAYFKRFDEAEHGRVWAQGDFVTATVNGGAVIHGRSDTTLNPGGVRIGTAEIYRQVEQLPEVVESLVFGQQIGDDVRVVLLVRLAEGASLDDELVARIRSQVRQGATPRHVPARIVAVDDLPRTRSGKIAELAVADVVNGREVRNTTALANPECLDVIAAAVPVD